MMATQGLSDIQLIKNKYILTMKIVLLSLLLIATLAFTEENNVLILTDDDLDQAISEHSLILVEFYAPWCGHCKKLAPVYDEVATILKNEGSKVRLAKIDCDAHTKAKSKHQVQGFPTLIFFSNGSPIKYEGQRSADFLRKWLLKKQRPALTELTVQTLEDLKTNGKVSIVHYGPVQNTQTGRIINGLAVSDDYNDYYFIVGTDVAEGSAHVFRPFGDAAHYPLVDEAFAAFISKHERPLVKPFDDRTIGDIFSSGKQGIFLFNAGDNSDLSAVFANSAQKLTTTLIFSQIPKSNAHLNDLANYIKTDPKKVPIVVIDGKQRSKYVLIADPESLTEQDIVEFVEGLSSHKKYKIDEEIDYSLAKKEAPADSEL